MIWINVTVLSSFILIFAYVVQQVQKRIDNLETNVTSVVLQLNESMDGIKSSIQHLGEIEEMMKIEMLNVKREIDEMKELHRGEESRVDSVLNSLEEDINGNVKTLQEQGSLIDNISYRIKGIVASLEESMSRLDRNMLNQQTVEENLAQIKSDVDALRNLYNRINQQVVESQDDRIHLKLTESKVRELTTEVSKQGHDITLLTYQMSKVQMGNQRAQDEYEKMKDLLSDLKDRLREEERNSSNWESSVGRKIFSVIDGILNMFTWSPKRIGP